MNEPRSQNSNQQRLIDIQEPDANTESDESEYGSNEFKPQTFAEFAFYFLLAQWLGPLTYQLFLRFTKNGYVLARNLHIYGGWEEIIRTLLWLGKMYCFILTFVFDAFNSKDQFWLVIYTDISLAVLYGAYYSSFTETEVSRFKEEVHDPGHGIITMIKNLIAKEKVKAFEKRILISRFPEIDVNNFYFVYPRKYENVIPEELDPQPLGNKSSQLNSILIKDGIIVSAEKYANYLADKGGYHEFKSSIFSIRALSRFIVIIRVLLPLAANILELLENSQKRPNYAGSILLIVQQAFYCYFIYRIAVVYDVLFLGLVLYYRKLKLLKLLRKIIDVRPQGSHADLLKISPTVPHNIENWLNLRKIFAAMNQQAFVVIDTNMSFALFYTIIFISIYALYSVSLLQDLLGSLAEFLSNNPMLQATIFVTLIIIIIVLAIHLTLGILINLQFTSVRRELTLQSEIIRSIRINHNIYKEWREGKFSKEPSEIDEYLERVDCIKSLLGTNFTEHFETYVKKLRDSISLVLDGLNYEEIFHPHTLLGIMTTPRLAVSVFTAFSAVGLSTINDIINRANKA